MGSEFHVDFRQAYSDLKLMLVKDCGYEIYSNKEFTKEHKKESKESAAGK